MVLFVSIGLATFTFYINNTKTKTNEKKNFTIYRRSRYRLFDVQ